MKVAAIIGEYNPMHKGHIYQIQQIKKLLSPTHMILVMSGHFVQRGGAAILDKWSRAKISVKNGIDLVIQIPEFYSTQAAQIFAKGSVNLLDSMKIVDYLCFSTEDVGADDLIKYHHALTKNKTLMDSSIKQYLKQGYSYPKSLGLSNKQHADINLSMPNEILAYEYIKAIIETGSSIKPFSIRRIGSAYNDDKISTQYPSATALRKLIKKSKLEDATKYIACENPDITSTFRDFSKFDEDFFNLIKYSLSSKIHNTQLDEIFEINEGIENLIEKKYNYSNTLEDLIIKIKSKRYTYNKIRRMLFNSLLDIKKQDMLLIKKNNLPSPYIRILGFNDKGRHLLSMISKTSTSPLINKVANYVPDNKISKLFLEKDIFATRIYNLTKKSPYYDDYLTSPIYLKG